MVPEYQRPQGMAEVTELLAAYRGSARVIAGGTDLFVKMKRKVILPGVLVDLTGITDLQKLEAKGHGLRIGAAVTHSQVARELASVPALQGLAEASRQVGSLQIRNLATVVGNVCNASPSADTAPPLLVLGAQVTVSSYEGERQFDLTEFFQGPGSTCLAPYEVVTELTIPPLPADSGSAYLKLSPRRQMDLAMVGVAAFVSLDPKTGTCEQCRVALGAVAPTPVRVPVAEEVLLGKRLSAALLRLAGENAAAAKVCCPITDLRASENYRRAMVGVLTRRALALAWERAGGTIDE